MAYEKSLVVWIDGPPKIEIDGDGVKVTYRSGDTEFVHRSSRASMRSACECGIRLLNEADRESRVVGLDRWRCG